MTTEQKIIRAKVGLLELAKQLGNVSQACKMMGYSRPKVIPSQNRMALRARKNPPAFATGGSAQAVSPSAVWSTDLRGLVLPEPRKAIGRQGRVSSR
jgi:hypothetical protein